jgi:hypothetical protein
MRKSKPPKNNELEGINEYDNTDEGRDTDKYISVELTVVITRARRILSSSQSGI